MTVGLILFTAKNVCQCLFVLGLALLGWRLVGDDAFGWWLTQALPGVGLHRLGDGELFRRFFLATPASASLPFRSYVWLGFCFEVNRVVA